MIRLIGSIALTLLLVGCQPETNPDVSESTTRAGSAAVTESDRLNAWFDEKYEERLQMLPTSMTVLGRKDKYDQIQPLTEEEEARRLSWFAATVDEMKSGFDYSLLEPEAKTSYDLWIYQYESAQADMANVSNSYIYTQMHGSQSQLPGLLINYHRVDTERDMVAYIARIGGISRGVLELLVRAQRHAENGVRPPYFAYDGVISESTKLITGHPFTDDGYDATLMEDANKKIDGLLESGVIDASRADQLRAEAETALINEFEPAYQALIDWFTMDRANTTELAQGASSLPNGAAYYDHMLARRTTTDLTPEQVHEIGIKEVARIGAEMEALMRSTGFEEDLPAFFAFIRENDQFYYPNTDAGRKAYISDTEKLYRELEPQLANFFGRLPKAGLEVRRVEPYREQDGAAQHYMRPSLDGSRPGVYYAHLSDMRAMPKYQMENVAMHEGYPGHHLQIAIAQELEGIPTFRRQAGFTAFSEGWGLYAESVAAEMGAYEDPYARFGQLTGEMWRAVRLVVDTGLHAKGWSEEQAVTYFMDKSPMAEGAIRSEVQRYLAWPGQATAYKIGQLKILELRRLAETELGESFDIRGFHDTVLGGGALPLSLLETRVRQWIESSS
jgi:uncharacterized protein (DUF885 family)